MYKQLPGKELKRDGTQSDIWLTKKTNLCHCYGYFMKNFYLLLFCCDMITCIIYLQTIRQFRAIGTDLPAFPNNISTVCVSSSTYFLWGGFRILSEPEDGPSICMKSEGACICGRGSAFPAREKCRVAPREAM